MISDDLATISSTLLPVSEKVSRIEVLALGEGALLQRLIDDGTSSNSRNLVPESEVKLAESNSLVLVEIGQVRELFNKEVTENTSGSVHVDNLIEKLDDIEVAYKTYNDLGQQLIQSRMQDNNTLLTSLSNKLDTLQNGMDTSIRILRLQVQDMTNDAVRLADQLEHKLLWTNVILTALAAILGLGYAVVITQILMRAIQNLVLGTEAVEKGNLDTEVIIVSQDEVGRLTSSFNTMVGEMRLKERIKDTFGKYMDPRIVNNLLDSPEFSEPGGDRREMSVMFVDLKGFTSISEVLPPDDLVRMINNFFGHMTNAIADNGGVVDKFMGDAVMAYWGPPFNDADDHAYLACNAAFEAFEHLEHFRADVREALGAKADELDIDLRIGVSSGDMIVGTIGSRVSMNYTVMGDPVNLGSRLEGASKAYGTHVLIPERTRELAGDKISVREIDQIRVKGKHEPTRIFELVGVGQHAQHLSQTAIDEFHAGLGHYRNRDWDAATTAFRSVLEHVPEDSASKVYLDRLSHLRDTPPGSDWDGVWTFETK